MRLMDRPRLLFLAERLSSMAITLASGVLVLRMLGPQGFAAYATMVGLGQIAATFGRLSLDEVLAHRFLSGDWNPRADRRLIGTRTVLGVLAGAGLWAATPSFGDAKPQLGHLLAIFAIALVEALAFQEVKLQVAGQFRKLSLLGMTRSGVGLVARVVVYIYGGESLTVLLCIAVGELLWMRIGSYLVYRPSPPSGVFVLPPAKVLAGYLVLTIVSLAYARIDFAIALRELSSAQIGIYLGAQRFVEPFAFVANVLGAMLMPQVASLNGRQAFAFALRTALLMGLLGLAVFTVNALLLVHLLPLLIGPSFEGSQRCFILLSLGMIPLFAGLPLGRIALAQGRPAIMVAGGVIAVLSTLAVFYSLANSFAAIDRLPIAMFIGNSLGCIVVAGVMGLIFLRLPESSSPTKAMRT